MLTDQPIPLLYSGQTGTYFGTEYEGLPAHVHPFVQEAAQCLTGQGLSYLGKLTCSQFSQVEIYAYATSDQRIAVSLMAGSSGLSGMDCVCKFTDGSFLTTTTTQVLPNAYDEQKLFRISMPGMNATELLAQHLDYVADFETRCGAVLAEFGDLLSIAQLVDEYTVRQQSNPGHFFLQLSSGLAQTGLSRFMANPTEDSLETDDDAEEDEGEDEDENEGDRIEYDASTASPLIQAILHNDVAQVEGLLQAGAELNPKGWDVAMPLVAAVYAGHPDMIQRLVAAGANLDQLDFEMNARPIGMAIQHNRPDLVRLLLDLGASPEGGDLEETGLAMAVRHNNVPILQMLLEAGADPDRGMEDDYRVIMQAALLGRLEMVQMLVAHGADVSAWSQGETAIMSAARNAHQAVYDYLYPLVDAETRAYADKHGKKDIERGLKSQARKANQLTEKLGDAAMYGQLGKVQHLLAEGAEANAITECGKSPLMLAAMYGHCAVIETLLDAGCDPNLMGDEEFDEDQTALMYIASSFFAQNRADAIRLLVERGADLNLQDAKGRSALMLAGENTDAVKALIDLGADVNLRDQDGNTALMSGSWAVQKLLRQAGASEAGLNEVALVTAARHGDLPKLEALLSAGVNVDYLDGNALVSASGQGHLEIVDRLIQAGADVNLGWKSGFTPIAEAAYRGDLAIVERLLTAGANPFQRTHDEEFHDALGYAQLGEMEGHHKDKDYTTLIAVLRQQQS
ncbi:MAG: ankyrin repeat domain-containing protein [Thermosynechococcaceae cyanobacterium]